MHTGGIAQIIISWHLVDTLESETWWYEVCIIWPSGEHVDTVFCNAFTFSSLEKLSEILSINAHILFSYKAAAEVLSPLLVFTNLHNEKCFK